MMSKDSVKKRLGAEAAEGMSFTEFTYQLVQGYDFMWLYEHKNCKLQMGGSDQWGNITTGTELIRRKLSGEAFAMTCPLITKADGGKFGKTEKGNIWLDENRTSPYEFYQFWLNVSDDDAAKYIKIFTMIGKEEIESLIEEHTEAPHQRNLQKRLANEMTIMVHGAKALEMAKAASQILFGKSTKDDLQSIDERTFLAVFDGVPTFDIEKSWLNENVNLVDLLAEKTSVFASKGELRRLIKGGGVSINKEKISDAEMNVDASFLLNEKYILIQKGKRNYFVLKCQ
jgi:tyrosyl-tRNA synthetase